MAWRSEVTVCKGPHCRARIIWLRSLSNKRMCFEADPISEESATADARGVFFRDDAGRAVSWSTELVGWDLGPLYRSHWGDCPDKDMFRKGPA
jgi:hypothetical protein